MRCKAYSGKLGSGLPRFRYSCNLAFKILIATYNELVNMVTFRLQLLSARLNERKCENNLASELRGLKSANQLCEKVGDAVIKCVCYYLYIIMVIRNQICGFRN